MKNSPVNRKQVKALSGSAGRRFFRYFVLSDLKSSTMKKMFIIAAALIASACGKLTVDNEDPKIEVLLLNGESQIDHHTAGNTLSVEVYVTDNEELVEVMVRIQNISNGDLNQVQKLLHFQSFGDIESKTFGETIEISTNDADLAGRYELLLQVADANGNVDTRTSQFVLLNPDEQPQVEINNYVPPAENGVVNLYGGDSLIINGWVTDNTGLTGFIVSLNGPQNIHHEQVNVNEPGFTGYSFDWVARPKVPENAASGDYVFSVTATDEHGHMTFYNHSVWIE